VNWQDSPRMKAAALAGVASNLAYPVDARIAAATEALDLLFEHLEQLDNDAIEAAEREDVQ
jgi:hypothetical protein